VSRNSHRLARLSLSEISRSNPIAASRASSGMIPQGGPLGILPRWTDGTRDLGRGCAIIDRWETRSGREAQRRRGSRPTGKALDVAESRLLGVPPIRARVRDESASRSREATATPRIALASYVRGYSKRRSLDDEGTSSSSPIRKDTRYGSQPPFPSPPRHIRGLVFPSRVLFAGDPLLLFRRPTGERWNFASASHLRLTSSFQLREEAPRYS